MNRSYPPNSLFAFRVASDDMSSFGILRGDIAVLFKGGSVSDRDTVALIEKDGGLTICRVEGETLRNSRVSYRRSDDIFVIGKMISLIRFYNN